MLESIYDWAYNQIEFIELGHAAAWRLITEEHIEEPWQLACLIEIGCY
jgi:hypothetical protein